MSDKVISDETKERLKQIGQELIQKNIMDSDKWNRVLRYLVKNYYEYNNRVFDRKMFEVDALMILKKELHLDKNTLSLNETINYVIDEVIKNGIY